MNKKTFWNWICCPTEVKENLPNPWEKLSFNSKDVILPRGNGIPTFIKIFYINEPMKEALIKISALGVFDVFINGNRLGRKIANETVFDELKPGWTDYKKRVLYYTYDIAPYLKNGENDIVVRVSNGWWSGRISFGYHGFQKNALIAELAINYASGNSQKITTSTDWKCLLTGPVMHADIWDGEYYDANALRTTKELIEDENCVNATIFEGFTGAISKAEEPFIRVRKHLERDAEKAVLYEGNVSDGSDFGKINIVSKVIGSGCERIKVKQGQTIQLDFSQNLVGWPYIKVKAQKGTEIVGYFAEELNDSGDKKRGCDGPEGSVYLANYRSAKSRVVYVCSGEGIEQYRPSHTFFGFRYLELVANGDFYIESVKAEVVGSDIKETGFITTSSDEVNKLFSNILWGQRGNYLSVPTDCPQRDERVGWTGDTQIFCGAAAYNADVRGFFKKWLQDVRDSQYDESLCDVIPRIFNSSESESHAAWSDAGIIVPYKIYKMYGDITVLEKQFESMEKYMNHLSKFGFDGAGTMYGDWLCYEKTDNKYIAVAYYYNNAVIMTEVSKILEKTARESFYKELSENILSYFKGLYMKDCDLTETTQTAYLLALKFGMLNQKEKENAVSSLKNKIITNNYSLSTGFVGTGILLQTLSEVGLQNLCYSLLLQMRNPSWLYCVRQGATTIWERWNSYTAESGFGDVNMNSFNHYAYGALAEWMYSSMAGIIPGEAGFDAFILKPQPDFRSPEEVPEEQSLITYVKAEYECDMGKIVSQWKNEDSNFSYSFSIPQGTTARLILPNTGKQYKCKDKECNDNVFNLSYGEYVFEEL
ncbi:MAG: family 78 glycoside hydrolase catalytic domain [Eubacteriales bacterium]|nr:family 78 glycoside hydrolase catalytic domain [Eubacteriales bacterium]